MSLERAYYDWITNDAYLSGNGYRLKSTGKKIAPWNKEVNAKYPDARYGDGNTLFHNDAHEWAKGKDLKKYDFDKLKDLNNDRYSKARIADANRTNKITIDPYNPMVKQWKRNQGSMDVLGVDTPVSVTHSTVGVSRRQPRISPKMPKLR
jgi:hypothetical protein